MKKSDLKTGMRVRMRNGGIYLVIKDIQHVNGHQELAFVNKLGFMYGDVYDENLINKFGYSNNFDIDIMEVYTINEKLNSLLQTETLNLDKKFSIWKRQEYTDRQKEIFKALKILGFNWIVRDSDYTIYAYESKPEKYKYDWQSHNETCIELGSNKILNAPHLNFINWEDEGPFEIPTL